MEAPTVRDRGQAVHFPRTGSWRRSSLGNMAEPNERSPSSASPTAAPPVRSTPTRWEKTLRAARLTAWVLLGGVLGYVGATLRAEFTLRDLHQSHAAEANRLRVLVARRDLHRATMELDRKNFGTAEQRLQEAAATLLDLTPAQGQYEALAKELRDQRLPVADDVSQERAKLFDLAQRFDELLDRPHP